MIKNLIISNPAHNMSLELVLTIVLGVAGGIWLALYPGLVFVVVGSLAVWGCILLIFGTYAFLLWRAYLGDSWAYGILTIFGGLVVGVIIIYEILKGSNKAGGFRVFATKTLQLFKIHLLSWPNKLLLSLIFLAILLAVVSVFL